MTELKIGDQVVRYDRESTMAAYGAIERGDAERCGCIFCNNFLAQRELVYPDTFKLLLDRLGIDPNKEGEVFHYGSVEDGCHLYGGWLYLVGELAQPGLRATNDSSEHRFTSWFTANCPDAPAFRGELVIAVEFTAHLDWVLPEKSDHGTEAR